MSVSNASSNIPFLTVVCSWTFASVALLFLSLWIWSLRLRIGGIKFGLDDFILILASITTFIMLVQITWVIMYEGQGKHADELSENKLTVIAKSLIANETIWGLVNTMIRISALIFTHKLFGVTQEARYAIRILMVLSIFYGLAIVLQIFLICRPMEAAYNTTVEGNCGNQEKAYLLLEIFGLIIDLAISALPIRYIWPLQVALRKKMGTCCLLSAGGIVIIVTGLRIGALNAVNSADFTYSEGYLGLLSILGALLNIITGCLPSLPHVWRRLPKSSKLVDSKTQINLQTNVDFERLKWEGEKAEAMAIINGYWIGECDGKGYDHY